MTEYYVVDRHAEDRPRTRKRAQPGPPVESQHVKVTLLGDFLLPSRSGESEGCDPYNSTQGMAPRETWRLRTGR